MGDLLYDLLCTSYFLGALAVVVMMVVLRSLVWRWTERLLSQEDVEDWED